MSLDVLPLPFENGDIVCDLYTFPDLEVVPIGSHRAASELSSCV